MVENLKSIICWKKRYGLKHYMYSRNTLIYKRMRKMPEIVYIWKHQMWYRMERFVLNLISNKKGLMPIFTWANANSYSTLGTLPEWSVSLIYMASLHSIKLSTTQAEYRLVMSRKYSHSCTYFNENYFVVAKRFIKFWLLATIIIKFVNFFSF